MSQGVQTTIVKRVEGFGNRIVRHEELGRCTQSIAVPHEELGQLGHYLLLQTSVMSVPVVCREVKPCSDVEEWP